MSNRNVGILEEISAQNLGNVGAADSPNSISIWSTCLSCLASWAIGNPGDVCTLTVECQDGC
ncbi:plantaricin C family lantibiotic [Microbispora rosea]|uniref:plantaricin C family lantibiotic n=1 Tax=Microbispora rosea TaxID=58117 RepID=UPI003436DF85